MLSSGAYRFHSAVVNFPTFKHLANCRVTEVREIDMPHGFPVPFAARNAGVFQRD
jgi:hypothetical protein